MTVSTDPTRFTPRFDHSESHTADPFGAIDGALAVIEDQCQVWGGTTAPLIPLALDGTVPDTYASILPGSAVDHVRGVDVYAVR